MNKFDDVDAEHTSHVMTLREAGMEFLILVMVGAFGYLAGIRPRRSMKNISSNAVEDRQRLASAVYNSFDKNAKADD